MNQYQDIILWVVCFGLGVAASFVRQMVKRENKELPCQIFWTSLYSGFTSLTASIPIREYGKLSAPMVACGALTAALSGTEFYIIFRNAFVDIVKKALIVPGAEAGKGHTDESETPKVARDEHGNDGHDRDGGGPVR